MNSSKNPMDQPSPKSHMSINSPESPYFSRGKEKKYAINVGYSENSMTQENLEQEKTKYKEYELIGNQNNSTKSHDDERDSTQIYSDIIVAMYG
jgi:hypothetical protein